jgi:penicillin amidase
MSSIRKFLQNIILGLLVLLLLILATIYLFVKSSEPIYRGEVHSKQINDTVKVQFGAYGIPHIYSQKKHDAFFALGYIQAQERLFQMDVLRRVGAGRLSEIFGPELVGTDHFFKALFLEEVAIQQALQFMRSGDDDAVECAMAFLNGINEFIGRGSYSPEFNLIGYDPEPFTLKDIYLIGGYMAFSFTEAVKTDPNISFIKNVLGSEYIQAFLPDTANTFGNDPAGTASVIRPGNTRNLALLTDAIPLGIWKGSNAIVIAPERSASGAVLFENDTHIGFQQPSVWYEAHMSCDDLEIYGNFLAGIPFPLTGHTRSITWGLTMFENDDLNFYREELKNENSYLHRGEIVGFNISEHTIKVRGGSDTTVIVRSTIHGPVVSDILEQWNGSDTSTVSMWWMYTDTIGDPLRLPYLLSHSQGIDEARGAASALISPGLNIVYGDTAGNIACWSSGLVPKFRDSIDTRHILDGSSGEDDPLGYHPSGMNPRIENPQEGYIVSANQNPHSESITITGYFAPDDRFNRLNSLIQDRYELTPGDLRAISLDNISVRQKTISDSLSSIIQRISTKDELNKKESRALSLLNSWDGSHDRNDVAPVIYYRLLSELLYQCMADELGEQSFNILVNTHYFKNSSLDFIVRDHNPWWDDVNTDHKEDRTYIIANAFKKTIRSLEEQFGSNMNNWAWGGLHVLEHEHPIGTMKPLNVLFNVGPYAAPGGIETVNNASFELRPDGRLKVKYGPAMRNILDMKNPALGWTINPTGQSGHFLSNHYNDQSEMFVDGRFRYMNMDPESSLEDNHSSLTFYPQK